MKGREHLTAIIGEEVVDFNASTRDHELILYVTRHIHGDVPKMLRRFIKSLQTTHMVEKWRPSTGGWQGEFSLRVKDEPVTIEADFELTATNSGCRYSITYHPRVAIPVVGRQVESSLQSQLTEGFVKLCRHIQTTM